MIFFLFILGAMMVVTMASSSQIDEHAEIAGRGLKGKKTKAPYKAPVKKTKSPNLKKKKSHGLSASPTSSPTSPLDYTSCANPGTQDTCLSGFRCVAGVTGFFCMGSCTTTADCTSKLGRSEFICEKTPFTANSVVS